LDPHFRPGKRGGTHSAGADQIRLHHPHGDWGFHDVTEEFSSPTGMILLELTGDLQNTSNLKMNFSRLKDWK